MMEKRNDKNEKMPKYREDNAAGGTYPGINNPEIEPPAYNPPVPNRAWTAMRKGVDIEELDEEEKRDLYFGKDNLF